MGISGNRSSENPAALHRGCIDYLLRRMDVFWSLFSVPIGIALCFGIPSVVWLLAELRSDGDQESGH